MENILNIQYNSLICTWNLSFFECIYAKHVQALLHMQKYMNALQLQNGKRFAFTLKPIA